MQIKSLVAITAALMLSLGPAALASPVEGKVDAPILEARQRTCAAVRNGLGTRCENSGRYSCSLNNRAVVSTDPLLSLGTTRAKSNLLYYVKFCLGSQWGSLLKGRKFSIIQSIS